MNLTYWDLLSGNRNFRNLWWGQLVSELGNWFNYVAAMSLVRELTGGSTEAAGFLLLIRTLPWAVLTPFAGTVADRISRRKLMLVTDLARVVLSLVFLAVTKQEHLWIAYVGTVFLSSFSAFFDAGKNAATPNVTGKDGLLSGTALMFSNRFLLMAVGAALGGWVSFLFGYELAFIVNAISFLVSAYSIWLIPEEAMQENETTRREKAPFLKELQEGLYYTVTNRFALTILLMNIVWAMGGGATFIVFEGLASKVFSNENMPVDIAFSILMTFNGVGLTLGMLIAHRAATFVERNKIERSFIGWSLVVHGILFAIAGFMPNIWLVIIFIVISRTIVGAEYAVQETIFQRSLPDHIRGRISTLDRGAEITMFSFSSYAAGVALESVSAQIVTFFSGILAGSAGLIWFMRSKKDAQAAAEEAEAKNTSG
jgi:MFS family permease